MIFTAKNNPFCVKCNKPVEKTVAVFDLQSLKYAVTASCHGQVRKINIGKNDMGQLIKVFEE